MYTRRQLGHAAAAPTSYAHSSSSSKTHFSLQSSFSRTRISLRMHMRTYLWDPPMDVGIKTSHSNQL